MCKRKFTPTNEFTYFMHVRNRVAWIMMKLPKHIVWQIFMLQNFTDQFCIWCSTDWALAVVLLNCAQICKQARIYIAQLDGPCKVLQAKQMFIRFMRNSNKKKCAKIRVTKKKCTKLLEKGKKATTKKRLGFQFFSLLCLCCFTACMCVRSFSSFEFWFVYLRDRVYLFFFFFGLAFFVVLFCFVRLFRFLNFFISVFRRFFFLFARTNCSNVFVS